MKPTCSPAKGIVTQIVFPLLPYSFSRRPSSSPRDPFGPPLLPLPALLPSPGRSIAFAVQRCPWPWGPGHQWPNGHWPTCERLGGSGVLGWRHRRSSFVKRCSSLGSLSQMTRPSQSPLPLPAPRLGRRQPTMARAVQFARSGCGDFLRGARASPTPTRHQGRPCHVGAGWLRQPRPGTGTTVVHVGAGGHRQARRGSVERPREESSASSVASSAIGGFFGVSGQSEGDLCGEDASASRTSSSSARSGRGEDAPRGG